MEERKVLKVVDRSETKDAQEVGKLLWVLTKKRDGRYKARLVYNGRSQRFKITNTYSSPTLSQQALVAALTIASQKSWDFKSMDVTSAFLYADLPSGVKIFSAIPEGHPQWDNRKSKVLAIEKNLYGLKEGPLLWWRHVEKFIKEKLLLKQSPYDECCFSGKNSILLIYVDDILLLGPREIINKHQQTFAKRFKVTSTETNMRTDFLGCEIYKDDDGRFRLSQVTYLKKVLKKWDTGLKNKSTPLPTDFDWTSENTVEPDFNYESC